MNVCEPGQDRNVAALSITFMCDGFLNFMEQTKDEKFMYDALRMADLAYMADEVPIGCVIVKNGEIISGGSNDRESKKDPFGHAEMVAIRRAAQRLGDWQLVDCELYVTVEPCIMCAGAIIQSRIKRVVFGAHDYKGGAFGGSINVLDAKDINHRPEVVGGVREEECIQMIQSYFKSKRNKKK